MGAKVLIPGHLAHVVSAPPKAVTMAIKALSTGTANADQQKQALDWIIVGACGTYDLSYRTDHDGGDRATLIAEGRRVVGNAIIKEIKIDAHTLKDEQPALRRRT